MPENDAFISKMSAVSFVRLMAELSGLPSDGPALGARPRSALLCRTERSPLSQAWNLFAGHAAIGEAAQAIVHGPKLLILDEPTDGLDPIARQRMIRLIREIRDGASCTLSFAPICCATLRTVAKRS